MSTKVVLITGAANGLGKSLTNQYLKNGWLVIATDIDQKPLSVLYGNEKARVLEMDVSSDDSVIAAFKALQSENITLDLIINNAGIDRYFPLSETPAGKFREVFEVNLFGGYRVNQVFLPLLKKPGGRIIHIGSESLHLMVPFMPYPLSKNLVERYAKVLRQELKLIGIDVIIVRPGAINTGLLENVRQLESVLNTQNPASSIKDPPFGDLNSYDGHRAILTNAFRNFVKIAPKNIGRITEPAKIAQFVFKVSGITRPKAVYRINNGLFLRIARLIPFAIMERLIRMQLTGK